MALDAGPITARLDLDEASYYRKLRRAQAEADKFERDQITLRVELDPQQMAKVRRQYAQLDEQISRDAQQRASRSTGGSLFGTLMRMTGRPGGGGGGGRGGGAGGGLG